jgi:hypothetical protein
MVVLGLGFWFGHFLSFFSTKNPTYNGQSLLSVKYNIFLSNTILLTRQLTAHSRRDERWREPETGNRMMKA